MWMFGWERIGRLTLLCNLCPKSHQSREAKGTNTAKFGIGLGWRAGGVGGSVRQAPDPFCVLLSVSESRSCWVVSLAGGVCLDLEDVMGGGLIRVDVEYNHIQPYRHTAHDTERLLVW